LNGASLVEARAMPPGGGPKCSFRVVLIMISPLFRAQIQKACAERRPDAKVGADCVFWGAPSTG
jgi:hypothetical protein